MTAHAGLSRAMRSGVKTMDAVERESEADGKVVGLRR
jgi:hypothetical protein